MSTVRLYVSILLAFVVILFTGLGTARANRWSVEIDGKMRAINGTETRVKVGAIECKIGANMVRGGVAMRSVKCTYQGVKVAQFVQTCGIQRDVKIHAGDTEHVVTMTCRIPPRRFR